MMHPAIRACVGAHQAFCRLGFDGKDIYVGLDIEGKVYIQLKAQEKEFTLGLGSSAITQEDFDKGWQDVCREINAKKISPEELLAIYHESFPYQNSMGFLVALLVKGFTFKTSEGECDDGT